MSELFEEVGVTYIYTDKDWRKLPNAVQIIENLTAVIEGKLFGPPIIEEANRFINQFKQENPND